MMKNKKGTIILSIILAVQFIIPLGVWGYETYKNKELEEKGQEVKLLVDIIYYDDNGLDFEIEDLENLIYSIDNNYIVFENNGSDYYTFRETLDISGTDLYVSRNRLYDWYNKNWSFRYEIQNIESEYDLDFARLYNKELEIANINHGHCEGPATEAYAVLKVYKNRFKVVGLYINGEQIESVVEKYINNELDNYRYEEVFVDYDDYYYTYDEELNEYVTEPVAA